MRNRFAVPVWLFQWYKVRYPDGSTTRRFFSTQENMDRALHLISLYPPQYKRAALLPLLHLAQDQLGWCSLSVMNYVAELLELPQMRVYEVATFYTMFKRRPVGKYHLQVCTTSPCVIRGCNEVLKAVMEEAGVTECNTTSPDQLFTVGEVECAGACVNAPVMSINDRDYYEDLTPQSAKDIVSKLKRGVSLDSIKAGPQPTIGEDKSTTACRNSCEPTHGRKTLLFEETGGKIPHIPGYGLCDELKAELGDFKQKLD